MRKHQPISGLLMRGGIAAIIGLALAGYRMQPVFAGAQAKPSRLDTVLDQMDTASKKFQSAQADVRQVIFTKAVQDTSAQTGQVYFLRKDGATQMGMKMLPPDAPAGAAPAQIVEFKDGKLRILNTGLNQVSEYSAAGHQALAETFLTLGFGGSGSDLKKAWTIDDQGPEQITDGAKTVQATRQAEIF